MRNIFFEVINNVFSEQNGELVETTTGWRKQLPYEEAKKFPCIHEGVNIAIPRSHDFKEINGIRYIMIKFCIDREVYFNKYYILNEGYNNETVEMLLATRAFRDGEKIDFSNIYNYKFFVYLYRDRLTGDYFIAKIQVNPQSFLYHQTEKLITDIPGLCYTFEEGDEEDEEILL